MGSPDELHHILGRVAVDRTIRFRAGEPQQPSARGDPAGVRCASCGTLVCEAARARVFAGMRLRCSGCGGSIRVA